MLKSRLERFDSPIVMVNQVFEGEDWGITASYISQQDVLDSAGEMSGADIGWRASVTLPDYDDVDFEEIFSTPEAALDFAAVRIMNGSLLPRSEEGGLPGEDSPFGRYHSIA